MRTVEMTIEQRLNVEALCNVQRGSVIQIRSLLRILELVTLSEDEKAKVKFELKKIGTATGESEIPVWSTELAGKQPPVPITFEDADAQRLKEMIENWPEMNLRALRWADPLLGALTDPA